MFEGNIMFENKVTLKMDFLYIFELKFSSESIMGIILPLGRTTADNYKEWNNTASEIES